jgi:CheY-like chemotaxis protein/signal transduction histidine kinase
MYIFDKIIDFFSYEKNIEDNMEKLWKTRVYSLILFLFFVITLTQGIYSLANENSIFAIVSLSFCCFFIFSMMLSYNRTDSDLWPVIHTSGILIYLAFIYLNNLYSATSSFTVVLFPFLAFIFCDKNRGLTLSLVFLLALLTIIFLPIDIFDAGKEIPKASAILHLLIGFITTIIAYGIKHLWEEKQELFELRLIEAQNKILQKEEVISQLSHHIRTPLSNIIGVIDLIEKTSLSDIQYDYVNTIHASANNMVNVVNGMVSDSNHGIQIIPSEEISFNIYATFNNVLRLFQDSNNPQKFSVNLSPNIPSTLIGNSILVKQIFLNIINSLIKYKQGEPGKISINVDCEDVVQGNVNLNFKISTVHPQKISKNSGSGAEMQKAQTARLIQQLDLSLTQQLIEAENKKMTVIIVETEIIIGFSLPFRENLLSSSVNAVQDKNKSSDSYIRNKVNIKDANILIVEDNFSNQQIITLYIKNEVNKIDVAFNGKEALDKFGTTKYDLILMDVQMPVMDGFKATQKIRDIERGFNTRTPIIAVTANAFPEDRERCLQAGMDDYISKPFQPEELISKIKKLLN